MKKLSLVLLALLFSSVAWGQKISQLPNANTLTGSEYMPMVQAGTTVKSTPAQILGYIDSQTITWSAAQTFQALATFSGGVSISSGATVAGGLTVSSGGLTVSSGNLAVNSGNLSVSGTSTLSGAVTASAGLTVSSGSLSVTGLNTTFISSGGDVEFTGGNGAPPLTTGVFFRGGNSGNIIQINASAPTDGKTYDSYISSTGSLVERVLNDAENISNTWLQVDRTGATINDVNFPNGTVEVAGYPLLAFAEFLTTGSSCSVSSIYDNLNISSCTRTATGTFTITFSVTFPLKPMCSVSGGNASTPAIVSQGASSQTSTSVYTMNASGTLTDGLAFNLSCH